MDASGLGVLPVVLEQSAFPNLGRAALKSEMNGQGLGTISFRIVSPPSYAGLTRGDRLHDPVPRDHTSDGRRLREYTQAR